MKNNKKLDPPSSTYLIAGAISSVLIAASIQAATPDTVNRDDQEQCSGVVKAGMNDCASAEHSCAGLNTEDRYDNDWIWLPTGTCSKIYRSRLITEDWEDS